MTQGGALRVVSFARTEICRTAEISASHISFQYMGRHVPDFKRKVTTMTPNTVFIQGLVSRSGIIFVVMAVALIAGSDVSAQEPTPFDPTIGQDGEVDTDSIPGLGKYSDFITETHDPNDPSLAIAQFLDDIHEWFFPGNRFDVPEEDPPVDDPEGGEEGGDDGGEGGGDDGGEGGGDDGGEGGGEGGGEEEAEESNAAGMSVRYRISANFSFKECDGGDVIYATLKRGKTLFITFVSGGDSTALLRVSGNGFRPYLIVADVTGNDLTLTRMPSRR